MARGGQDAIAILLDTGPAMADALPGHSSCLETCIDIINVFLQRKIFQHSKDEVCLILFGSEQTANALYDGGDGYVNIAVAHELGPITWQLCEHVQNSVHASRVGGDFVDAIVVAMDYLVKGTQGRKSFEKGSKRIMLLSNFGSPFGDDNIEAILAGMKQKGIELNVIGTSYSDEDSPSAQAGAGDNDAGDGSDQPGPSRDAARPSNVLSKSKSPQQQAGEEMVARMLEGVEGGVSYSFRDAMAALTYFESRGKTSMPWHADLQLGKNLKIAVSGFKLVKREPLPSFKPCVARNPDEDVERRTDLQLKDEQETAVDRADVVKGHRYGTDLVPFTEDDMANMKYKCPERCLSVLGFTKLTNIKRHHYMGDGVLVLTARKDNVSAAVAMSALVKALYETNTAIIVRRAYNRNSSPYIGCLLPHVKAKYECLHYVELPFAEDLRQYTFGSLPLHEFDTINKQFAPTKEQLDAIDGLIDNMDLSAPSTSTGGDTGDALKCKNTRNPTLQRLFQCLQHRVFHEGEGLPDVPPILSELIMPQQDVQAMCADSTKRLQSLFKLDKLQWDKEHNAFKDSGASAAPQERKLTADEAAAEPKSLRSIMKSPVVAVGTTRPVEDFIVMLSDGANTYDEACTQMQDRIKQIISDSFGNSLYGKAMDCIKEFRRQAAQRDPSSFNDLLQKLKLLLAETRRTDFWDLLVAEKLSLISSVENKLSPVSPAESKAFLSESKQEPEPMVTGDDDDLLDMM